MTSRIRKSTDFSISNILRIIVLCIVAFLALYPILWMISSSFKSRAEVFTPTASLFPETWVFTNYADALAKAPFGLFFKNSMIIAGITVSAQLITSSLAAYGFSKIQFKGRKVLFSIILVGMMIPSEASIIPNYIFVDSLKLRNTPYGIAMLT